MDAPDYRTWLRVLDGDYDSCLRIFEAEILTTLQTYSPDVRFLVEQSEWFREISQTRSGFEALLSDFHADPNGMTLKWSNSLKTLAVTIISLLFRQRILLSTTLLNAPTTLNQTADDLAHEELEKIFIIFSRSVRGLQSDPMWFVSSSHVRFFALKAGCPTVPEDPLDCIDALRHHVSSQTDLARSVDSPRSEAHGTPSRRSDFQVAIMCALPREADAISLLFDKFWDDEGYSFGRARGDTNTYITGRIGIHDVVLVILSASGTTSAAAAAAGLRTSFPNLHLVLFVGVCGGVPSINGHDVFLGDVVISKEIIEFDSGRQYPGHFRVKRTIEDDHGANRNVRNFLTSLETELGRERLQASAAKLLKRLQHTARLKRRRANYDFPGIDADKLFSPSYRHVHRSSCITCCSTPASFCENAAGALCAELRCDEANLIPRTRDRTFVNVNYGPEIFMGCIGSSNMVMKSGEDRDRLASEHGIIAFEMEGAGALQEVPCIVVKGVSDHADSHKNDMWQDFASATAASVARAMLERYSRDDIYPES